MHKMNKTFNSGPDPTIVLCIGMKRSGSTLQYNMSRLLLEQHSTSTILGYVDGQFLKSEVVDWRKLRNYDSKYIILKCHNPPWEVGKDLLTKHKIMYIYRDLRSVYFSMKSRTNITINEFILEMKKSLELYEHYENDNRVLVQKYEDVYLDNEAALLDISTFTNIEIDVDKVTAIANSLDIFKAKKRWGFVYEIEQQRILTFFYRLLIRTVPRVMISVLKEIPFFVNFISFFRRLVVKNDGNLMYSDHISKSKGNPLAWKDHLSVEEVCKIELEFNRWLSDHGYL